MTWTIPTVTKTLLLGIFLSSCTPGEKQQNSFTEYDLTIPERFDLPEYLLEISGIAFNKGENGIFYAVQDEEGKVFQQGWQDAKQKYTRFADKGDFEDVSVIQNEVVVLKSNGSLYSFPVSDLSQEESKQVQELKKPLPKGEYEGMYGDEKSGKLYVLCKECEADNSRKNVSGYIVDLKSPDNIQTFTIDVEQIAAISEKMEKGFRPSALAQNPIDQSWYIVSSVNQLLVITDLDWKVKNTIHLDRKMFPQPEGIAFDADGTMYISNEGGKQTTGNILKFKRTEN